MCYHSMEHWAAEKGQQKACALLMERDADVYAADPKATAPSFLVTISPFTLPY